MVANLSTRSVMPMTVSIKSLERRRLLVDISTMLQFWIFLIALIGLVIELIKLSQKKLI
ncbi:hypothetical protein BVL87_11460 [Staphylococcus epidermidis]|nr:hypothetical protein BVL87_11460 [Staphylococcus epidermidis]